MQSRLVAQMMPCTVVTLLIAQWNGALLGTAKLETVVITVAWAAAVVHQFLTSRRREPVQRFRWSLDLILSALGGQVLWVVLPWLQFANPDAWYSVQLTIPPTLTATGAIVALCWPLQPFVMRVRARHASARHSEFDAPALYGSFFLLSGNLIFAVGAYASVVTLLARRMKWPKTRPTVRLVNHSVTVCRI